MSVRKSRKCPTQHKTMFPTEQDAGRAMMRIWSHDPSANIYDLHTYKCPDCGTYHIGHISYYKKSLDS
jgi:hypothetical protein